MERMAWQAANIAAFRARTIAYSILLITGLAGGEEPTTVDVDDPLLRQVIGCVKSNEAKLSTIKMAFVADFAFEGSLPDYALRDRRITRAESKVRREEIEWAQDGIRQRFVRRSLDENGLGLSQIDVVDGEVHRNGDWPELKRGGIAPVSNYTRWMANFVSRLFYRPICLSPRDWPLLSEALASGDMVLNVDRQKLNDKDVYVVDIKSGTSGSRRLYIDREMGLLLRSDTYTSHPDSEQAKLVAHTELTKFHPLGNGGWVPLEGRRTSYGEGFGRRVDMHVHVDVNSISVNRADIPDSLFQLDFPGHTVVYNYILGTAAQVRAERIADHALSDFDEMPEETEQVTGNVPSGSIDDGNDDTGEAEPGDDAQEESRADSRAGADEAGSSGDLAWTWGMRQVGLLLVVAGVTALVLALRRGFRTQ
jgi:hypothetical protein